MLRAHRTLLAQFQDGDTTFSVERWFMPMDSKQESETRFALVLAVPGMEERGVILAPDAAAAIGQLLSKGRP